jgi:hypothetical protein
VSTTDNRTVCERLDHLARLLVCLADALRQGTEYRENDETRPPYAPAPGMPVQGNLGTMAAAVRAPYERTR